jgi:hypothetical protein
MRSRILFFFIAAFWLVMNFLLWRSQWDSRSQIGNRVQVESVWQRILTCPDPSSLDIFDRDKKIGFCHWNATAGNSPLINQKIIEQDYAPDATETKITGYTLNFEGNTGLTFTSNRVRFEGSIALSTNQEWKDLRIRLSVRPQSWEVRASAASQKVVIKASEGGATWTNAYTFSELQNPERLLAGLGGNYWLQMIGLTSETFKSTAGSMQWEAHEDRMRLGHSRVRAYRLETHILGRAINVYISQVGEILWIDLPQQINLRNEAFGH